MNRFPKASLSQKTSQAMARCILTGVGGAVSTYLVWRVVEFKVGELPFSFHLTCGLILGLCLFATTVALYRLSLTPSVGSSEKKMNSLARLRRAPRAPLVMPLTLSKNELAWFERN